MENQVANLKKKNIRCDFLSSTRTAQDRGSILQDIKSAAPNIRLLFVTPELLSTEGFIGTLKAMSSKGNLTLFAVDEAHCISSWYTASRLMLCLVCLQALAHFTTSTASWCLTEQHALAALGKCTCNFQLCILLHVPS